jgi:hypothetical protein
MHMAQIECIWHMHMNVKVGVIMCELCGLENQKVARQAGRQAGGQTGRQAGS